MSKVFIEFSSSDWLNYSEPILVLTRYLNEIGISQADLKYILVATWRFNFYDSYCHTFSFSTYSEQKTVKNIFQNCERFILISQSNDKSIRKDYFFPYYEKKFRKYLKFGIISIFFDFSKQKRAKKLYSWDLSHILYKYITYSLL